MARGLWINVAPQGRSLVKFHLSEFRIWNEFSPWGNRGSVSCSWILTLNVPGDCGSSRPTRVEPRLHCVGIAWQVRKRCVDSAAHSPLHAMAAHAFRASAHSASRALIAQPAHFAWTRALCVDPRTLRVFAHFADRVLDGPCIDILFNAIFNPFNLHPIKSRPISSKANTILAQGQSRVNHATKLSKQQPYRRVSNLVPFQNFAKSTNLHFLLRIRNMYQESRLGISSC